MALKFRLTQKQYDSLDESVQALYDEDNGDFILQVDGAVDKKKLAEFRTSNRTLQTKLADLEEKYGDLDLDKVQALLQREQELEEGKLIKEGDIDTVVEGRLKKALKPVTEENETLKTSLAKRDEQLNQLLIDQNITKIATKMGAHSTAIDDICYRARQTFKIQEGKPVALDSDGDPILNGSGDHITMEDWMGSLKTKGAPHCFQGVKGGNEQGSDHTGRQSGDMTSHDKIKSGLAKL